MAVATELLTVDRATLAARRMGVAAWPAYDGREPFAEAFLAAFNLSTPLRCAHAFAASWRESPKPIGATELFVGVPQPWRAICLDRAAGIMVNQGMIQRLGTANLATLAAAMTEFETGRIIRQEKSAAGVPLDGSLGSGPSYQGHMLPDYATVLAHGIDGFASRLAATPAPPRADDHVGVRAGPARRGAESASVARSSRRPIRRSPWRCAGKAGPDHACESSCHPRQIPPQFPALQP